MIREDHRRQTKKLNEAYKEVEKLLDEWQMVFARTQPGSGGSEVKTSPRNDKFDAYVIASDIITDRLNEEWEVIGERKKLLAETEKKLAQSHDTLDRLYYCTMVKGMTIHQTAIAMHYTERQIRRLMLRI